MGIPNELDPWLSPYLEPASRARPAPEIRIYRIDGDGAAQYLPNLRLMDMEHEIGAVFPLATLRYVFADNADGNIFPNRPEHVLNTAFIGPYILNEHDRIRITGIKPDGEEVVLFEGEVKTFGHQQHARCDRVTVKLAHISYHEWAKPVQTYTTKDEADYQDPSNPGLKIRGQAFFNPRGMGNRCEDDEYVDFTTASAGDIKLPVFRHVTPYDTVMHTTWKTNDAVLYLCYTENPQETYTYNPTPAQILDALVHAESESPPGTDPEFIKWTYTYTTCEYTPLYGKYWLPLIEEICRNKNVLLAIRTVGTPLYAQAGVDIWRPDAVNPKWLFLQNRGADLDPVLSNTAQQSIVRDVASAANIVRVHGAPFRTEASFILACDFPMSESDGNTISARKQWRKDAPAATFNPGAYRDFVFDEAGEGHYLPATDDVLTDVPSLDAIFGEPSDSIPTYIQRRRRPIGRLFSHAGTGSRRAALSISKDYEGPVPAVWTADEGGTWQNVDSGWELLEDRIGIRITVDDPNEWHITQGHAADAPYKNGVVRVVESLALDSTRHPKFYLRLTVVVEHDEVMEETATHDTSDIPYPVERIIDASDRYHYDRIQQKSQFAPEAEEEPLIIRDDKETAKAEAEATLLALRAGRMEGAITLDRFTTYYQVGDRIAGVWGRGVSFATSPDTPPVNEYPGIPQPDPIPGIADFPYVVKVTHTFEPRLQTILQLAGYNDVFRR